MTIGDGVRFEWHRFDDFAAPQLYELLRFRQAIFVVEQASPFPDLDGLDERALHLLAALDGATVGYTRLIPYPAEGRVAIGRVAVAPPLRGAGLARRMMSEALMRCASDYSDCAVALSAQTYLVPFYQSLGFRAVSGPSVDYGIAHVEMLR